MPHIRTSHLVGCGQEAWRPRLSCPFTVEPVSSVSVPSVKLGLGVCLVKPWEDQAAEFAGHRGQALPIIGTG